MLTRVLSCFADATTAVWVRCKCKCVCVAVISRVSKHWPAQEGESERKEKKRREKNHWIKLFIAHIFVVGAVNINNTCIIFDVEKQKKPSLRTWRSERNQRQHRRPQKNPTAKTALQYNIWRIYGTLIVSGDLLMRCAAAAERCLLILFPSIAWVRLKESPRAQSLCERFYFFYPIVSAEPQLVAVIVLRPGGGGARLVFVLVLHGMHLSIVSIAC